MIWLILAAAELVISSAPCVKPTACHYSPQYWQALTPGSDGQFMVYDAVARHWRWHDAKEMADRD